MEAAHERRLDAERSEIIGAWATEVFARTKALPRSGRDALRMFGLAAPAAAPKPMTREQFFATWSSWAKSYAAAKQGRADG